MPTVFSKLYNRKNLVKENLHSLVKAAFKYRERGKSWDNIVETRKEIRKRCTSGEYSNEDLWEIIENHLLDKIGTPWMNHLRQI